MKNYCNSKSKVMTELCNLYIKDDIDILGFKASSDNYITYHHLISVEELNLLGFPTRKTVANGLALTKNAHSYLHLIENFAPDIYENLNKIIFLITKERRYPDIKEMNRISILLECFEYRMSQYYKINPIFLTRSRTIVS